MITKHTWRPNHSTRTLLRSRKIIFNRQRNQEVRRSRTILEESRPSTTAFFNERRISEAHRKRTYKKVILKTIPNKWLQDLRRANNHNMATIEELKSVLKPIEEADENDQENLSRLKGKPRFDRQNNDRRQGKGNNPCKKDGQKHDWKDCPDNKYVFKHHKSHQQERQYDSCKETKIRFEDRHESNMIESNKHEDDFEGFTNFSIPYESDSESESDDEKSVDETHLIQTKSLKKTIKSKKSTVAKATVKLPSKIKRGKRSLPRVTRHRKHGKPDG